MQSVVPTMLITGPLGVGKTAVAAEVSELLDQAGVAHALVDVDGLRWCYPRPSLDPFRVELAMKNLAAIWANFQAAGAARLILADVLEAREHLERYRAAVPGAAFTVVRLQASLSALEDRLKGRETGSALARHLRRAAEVAALMERNHVEDILVETDSKAVAAIAHEVLLRSDWGTAQNAR